VCTQIATEPIVSSSGGSLPPSFRRAIGGRQAHGISFGAAGAVLTRLEEREAGERHVFLAVVRFVLRAELLDFLTVRLGPGLVLSASRGDERQRSGRDHCSCAHAFPPQVMAS
jgi:hypothetical protein